MKYIVRKSVIQVIGPAWMPRTTAATSYTLTAHDVENCKDDDGNITRESVELWLGAHSGDFSEVTDFFASLEAGAESVDLPWEHEESEITYNGCMFPDDDDDDDTEEN